MAESQVTQVLSSQSYQAQNSSMLGDIPATSLKKKLTVLLVSHWAFNAALKVLKKSSQSSGIEGACIAIAVQSLGHKSTGRIWCQDYNNFKCNFSNWIVTEQVKWSRSQGVKEIHVCISLTFYIFLYFFQQVHCRRKMRDVVSEVDFFWGPRRWILATTGRTPREWSGGNWNSARSQEVRRGLGENLSLKLWWLLSTVAQAVWVTWKHVSYRSCDTFHLAWRLDPWLQILSTYDRASKRGWVRFSVCVSCEGIEAILKLCWTSHFILGLSNGKIERVRLSERLAITLSFKVYNATISYNVIQFRHDLGFVAKLQLEGVASQTSWHCRSCQVCLWTLESSMFHVSLSV